MTLTTMHRVYAQDAPQWGTKVDVNRTRLQIMETLQDFGVDRYGFDGGALTFEIDGAEYRVTPEPLPVRAARSSSSYTRTPEEMEEQAMRQAWRIMYDYVLGITKMAWITGVHRALLQFLVLPGGTTLGEIATEVLTRNVLPAPPAPADDVLDIDYTS